MRRNFFIAACLVGAALFFTGCDSEPKISPLHPPSTLLAFGDSLTHGNGAARGQAYPDILGQLIGQKVINAGVPGEVTAEGLKRLPGVLERHQPTLVLLCEGGNDFLRRHDLGETRRNLKAMIALIKAAGADVVLIGVPKLGFGLDVPAFFPELANEFAIPYEGDILLDLLDDNTMKSDAIHPNATGYRRMAEAIYAVIQRAQK